MVDLTGREPSLSRLERESEQTRAQLAQTVDELRTRISPAALKQDVRDYVRHTGQDFLHNVERRARENPLQAVAIAAGLAYPAWRIVRSIPAPILLIGAGLALTRTGGSTPVGDGQASAAGGLLDDVREKVGGATEAVKERARQAADVVQQAVSGAAERMSGAAESVQSAVLSRVESVRAGTAEAASGTGAVIREAKGSAATALSSARDQATQATRRAQDSLVDAMERHPMVVGGIGLFIGAMLAAAIPSTRAENRLLGDTSDELKNRAGDLASQGYATAKDAAEKVYEAGKQAAEQQGLSPAAVRDTLQDLAEKARTVYGRATDSTAGDGQSQRLGALGQDASSSHTPRSGTGGTT
jgi:ElaB/YqjD/DUF883 family membrane-anchored ribosome-binding protein